MANINKIRISGTSYDIQDKNAAKTVTLTQSEYDSLTVKDPNVFYIISDSEYTFDGYWTSAQTNSAITEAVSGKADSSSVYLKSETSGATEISTALNDKLDATAYTPTDLSNYYTTAQTNTKISQAVSGKTNQSDFTAHTSNASIHVTAQDKTNWNNKSDFSGSYNDLTDKPTIPTVPTSNTAFTNDAGYITDSALEDYATESYVTTRLDGKQDTLESGVNIKTVNNYSLLGSGNINIGGTGSNNVVELTQAEYDALDPKDPSAFYIITDAEGGDLANYMTSAQTTSAITQAVSGKTDNSDFTAHTGNSDIHVTSAEKAAWNAKSDFSGSYNDLTNKLSAGTNITIVDNVISAEGSGGGKAVTGGTNISITTGETADTINCTLPITAGTGSMSVIMGNSYNIASNTAALSLGTITKAQGQGSAAFGERTETTSKAPYSFTCGGYTITRNWHEFAGGKYNVSNSGSTSSVQTLFSVGNGTSNARHNAFEIRQKGDIYCSDGTNDVKLQDTIKATAANTTALGGLKLVKLSQSEYDSLATKDSNTLYIVTDS